MTGINIQTPWSELLINEVKSVETRSYHLPEKYVGEELALIETPGRYGRFKARIIGTITFSHSFKYPDQKAWQDDYNRHCVAVDDVRDAHTTRYSVVTDIPTEYNISNGPRILIEVYAFKFWPKLYKFVAAAVF